MLCNQLQTAVRLWAQDIAIHEGSFAEVMQLIAALKCVSFLTPDMASKKYARHVIDLFSAMSGIIFLSCLASKT